MDPPTTIPPADACSFGARALQLGSTSFVFPDSSCNIEMQENTFNGIQQQFGDVMLPSNGYGFNNNNNNNTSNSYSTTLPPPPTLPLPWCHGLSSDADYYGHGMVGFSTDTPNCHLLTPSSSVAHFWHIIYLHKMIYLTTSLVIRMFSVLDKNSDQLHLTHQATSSLTWLSTDLFAGLDFRTSAWPAEHIEQHVHNQI